MKWDWVAFMVKLVALLGTKAKDAWPHLEIIGNELLDILQIVNNGKPIAHSGPITLDSTAIDLTEKLTDAGVPTEKARKFAETLTTANDRLTS